MSSRHDTSDNSDPSGRFRRKKTCRIIAECLKKELEGKEFDEADARGWSTSIADAVKSRLHAESAAPRYKIVVQTFVGQQRLQDVRITSRCLWDNDHDNHASAVFHSVRRMRTRIGQVLVRFLILLGLCRPSCSRSNTSGPRASSSASTPSDDALITQAEQEGTMLMLHECLPIV